MYEIRESSALFRNNTIISIVSTYDERIKNFSLNLRAIAPTNSPPIAVPMSIVIKIAEALIEESPLD